MKICLYLEIAKIALTPSPLCFGHLQKQSIRRFFSQPSLFTCHIKHGTFHRSHVSCHPSSGLCHLSLFICHQGSTKWVSWLIDLPDNKISHKNFSLEIIYKVPQTGYFWKNKMLSKKQVIESQKLSVTEKTFFLSEKE